MAKKEKKPRKVKPAPVDGLGEKDVKRIRTAIRNIWRYSTPRKLAEKRAYWHKDGFPRCELCKKKAPKIFVDHIIQVGDVDEGFLKRMYTPSCNLQSLCKKCHDEKTKEERKQKAWEEMLR